MLKGEYGKKIIALKMKPEWRGKEITVMPYLNSPTEIVSVKTEVMRGNIRTKLGEKHYKAVSEKIEKSPNHVKIVWKRFEDELGVKEINAKDDDIHYDPKEKCIYINIEKDAKYGNYWTTIHEAFHSLDFLAMSIDLEMPFSYSFKDKFDEAIAKDFDIFKKNIAEEYKVDVNNEEDICTSIEKKYSNTKLAGRRFFYTPFLDILDGITKGKLDLPDGHGKDYWAGLKYRLYTEIFANIAASEIANLEGLEIIKEHFKKTYNIYLEMLNEMSR